MKGKDKYIFLCIIHMSLVIGVFVFDQDFHFYSEMITFLSILIGLEIASLAILFNSPLKAKLWDNKDKYYKTELHRLKYYYMHAIYFDLISVIIIFFTPDVIISFKMSGFQIIFEKYLIIAPIILGSVFCFYKICNELFRIFTYPTNN